MSRTFRDVHDLQHLECRSPRKNRLVAYFLSLFLGFTGADRAYMGLYFDAACKLVTLGGLGIWWVHDIVWIGSGPVYGEDHRLADDLDCKGV